MDAGLLEKKWWRYLWDYEFHQNLLPSSIVLLENKEKAKFEILTWVLINEEINVSTE